MNCVYSQSAVHGQTRSGKTIRIDFTPSLARKSSCTVWFATSTVASVILSIVPSTTPNGAPFGDHHLHCMNSG